MKTFPNPLTVEEEISCLKKSREGDGAAREMLILHNMRLVAHLVKKYQNPETDIEDLLSIGTIGLIKAIDTVDYKKGRLSTYAARCIENELLMYFRARKKLGREVSYYEPIGTDKEGNEIHLLDIMEVQEPEAFELMLRKEETRRIYDKIPELLNQREQTVICMRYGLYGGKEYTQREVAQKLGISRSYVSRIEKMALEKLKSCF
ncbi:MAG: RNA polymerase sporulation sigma factor SigK [Lachnospiraceae bacterium]